MYFLVEVVDLDDPEHMTSNTIEARLPHKALSEGIEGWRRVYRELPKRYRITIDAREPE